jgi:hypothetical protein
MRLFLAEIAAGHGSVRRYVVDQVGIDEELITAMRMRFLSAAAP